jgi:hypothetical protein
VFPALTAASVVTCPHAGQVTHMPSQSRVLIAGSPALVQADQGSVVGCAFTIPPTKPSPCTTVRWTVGAVRVMVGGVPLLLATSVGLANSPEQAPQGPPIVSTTQPRVQGT